MNLLRYDIMSDYFYSNTLRLHCKNSLAEKSSISYNIFMTDTQLKNPTIIGFREWISLPALHLTALKAKIDTGAKTSSLHAFGIKLVKRGGKTYVKFNVHPIQNNLDLVVACAAPLIDRRVVTDSGGHKELRYVINTTIHIGGVKKVIELTLTNRETMKYRMLLGREALKQFYIDPSQSYLLKKNQKQRNYLKDVKQGLHLLKDKDV
jgi:hypothetical protein